MRALIVIFLLIAAMISIFGGHESTDQKPGLSQYSPGPAYW